MTNKQLLWQSYYAAVKTGRKTEAQQILKQIHQAPAQPRRTGGCSKCRKRLG